MATLIVSNSALAGPPPPVDSNWLPLPAAVFFDCDDARLDGLATRHLERLAKDMLAQPGVREGARVLLAGHTDRHGGEAENQALSVRRAEAVRARLVALGFAASRISIEAFGEARPLADTPDGVRERQNCRVEISLARS
jgi:outer membrane protein OmpA-like peptidoglycan-associated protein